MRPDQRKLDRMVGRGRQTHPELERAPVVASCRLVAYVCVLSDRARHSPLIILLPAMKLSIVTSLYESEPYVAEFHRRIRAVAAEITADCEIIYVNDGSPDGALGAALRLREEDDRVTVVDLSRNFGHHRALMVGLSYSNGDFVFMIDVDLEEEPELLRAFYARFVETGADSVYGVQSERK